MRDSVSAKRGEKPSTGYNSMLLAMTRTIEEEEAVKRLFTQQKKRFAVTEVGGNSNGDFYEKLAKAVLGASMNNGVIIKNTREVHALLHATQEAFVAVRVNIVSEANLAMKVAIVRDEDWISVSIFGESAFHILTGHERCGMGTMHI